MRAEAARTALAAATAARADALALYDDNGNGRITCADPEPRAKRTGTGDRTWGDNRRGHASRGFSVGYEPPAEKRGSPREEPRSRPRARPESSRAPSAGSSAPCSTATPSGTVCASASTTEPQERPVRTMAATSRRSGDGAERLRIHRGRERRPAVRDGRGQGFPPTLQRVSRSRAATRWCSVICGRRCRTVPRSVPPCGLLDLETTVNSGSRSPRFRVRVRPLRGLISTAAFVAVTATR